MNVNECITTRRSIRKYKPDPVDHSLIESIVSMASFLLLGKILRSPVISQLMILLFLKKSQMIVPRYIIPISYSSLPC